MKNRTAEERICTCGHISLVHDLGEGSCWSMAGKLCMCMRFKPVKATVRCGNGHNWIPEVPDSGFTGVTEQCPLCGSLTTYVVHADGCIDGLVTSTPDGWLWRILAFWPPLLRAGQEARDRWQREMAGRP